MPIRVSRFETAHHECDFGFISVFIIISKVCNTISVQRVTEQLGKMEASTAIAFHYLLAAGEAIA